MSGTLVAGSAVVQKWKVEVYETLGEKVAQRTASGPIGLVQPEQHRQPLKAELSGDTAPSSRVGKMLAERLLGSSDDRHNDRLENRDQADVYRRRINQLQREGAAAPVQIAGEGGRQLRGNFFSAKGHNLKEASNKPDTSRPIVLLLTGSGGTAEFQGCDLAEFYADAGASVLSVNYAGFGGSDEPPGTPCELSLKQDAQSMLQYLVDLGYDPGKIIIHGFSMGGAIAAELQEANEKNGTKFRGVVLDRPMLSAMHGVEGHFGKVAHAAGALTRDLVGAFQGERAVKRLNSDTPLVITTDKGRFAERADALRQQLQAPGTASGSDHLNSGSMITANRSALEALIAKDRTGADDRIRTPESPDQMPYEQLKQILKDTVKEIKAVMEEATANVPTVVNARDTNAAVDLLNKLRKQMGELLDLTTCGLLSTPSPELDTARQTADMARKKIEGFCRDLHTMLSKPGEPFPCSQEEIDFAGLRAAEALQRLDDAPANTNKTALEQQVLEAQGLRFALGITNEKVRNIYGNATLRKVFENLQERVDDIRARLPRQ
jgi:acetyl esterase/lipase